VSSISRLVGLVSDIHDMLIRNVFEPY